MSFRILKDLWAYRSTLIVILTPLLFSPLLIDSDKKLKCLYVILIMAVYWITETVPIGITSLLPLILFPIFGILTAKQVANEYVQDPLVLFTGGFFVAMAAEEAQLHRRIALKSLLIVGENTKWILFGLMVTTGFLSMWIINAAAAAMMVPILHAILEEIFSDRNQDADAEWYMIRETSNKKEHSKEKSAVNYETMKTDDLNMCKMMYLSICYSSSIGGVGTLTGTPPNVIVLGILETRYDGSVGISFASWMALAIPIVIINTLISWLILHIFFMGFKKTFSFKSEKTDKNVKRVLQAHYDSLGPIRFREFSVLVLFGILVMLWMFRSPKFVKGWGDYFENQYVSDGTAAMLVAFLLFILPSEWPDFLCNRKRNPRKNPIIREPLLTWSVVHAKYPWQVMWLLGGSFAMAAAIQKSGLSSAISNKLAQLHYLGPFGICSIGGLLATFVTEFTSNHGAASILAPVLAATAEKLHVNPLYLVLTGTICVSYAFMLPASTAPNAVVYGYCAGIVKVIDMVKVGFFLNCITVGVTILAINTWGWSLYDMGTYPMWAPQHMYNDSLTNLMNNVTIV